MSISVITKISCQYISLLDVSKVFKTTTTFSSQNGTPGVFFFFFFFLISYKASHNLPDLLCLVKTCWIDWLLQYKVFVLFCFLSFKPGIKIFFLSFKLLSFFKEKIFSQWLSVLNRKMHASLLQRIWAIYCSWSASLQCPKSAPFLIQEPHPLLDNCKLWRHYLTCRN